MDNNYASWPADRLREAAAWKAGWTDIDLRTEKEYGPQDHDLIMRLTGIPPGSKTGTVMPIPDYTGSVDAALGLPHLLEFGFTLRYVNDDTWMALCSGMCAGYAYAPEHPALAIVRAWLKLDDWIGKSITARASEQERQP